MRKRHEKSSPHKDVSKMLRKMRLNDGDVLLIRRDSPFGAQEKLEQLESKIQEIYKGRLNGLLFIVVETLDDIRKADDKVMREQGWIRWPRGAKQPLEKEDEDGDDSDLDQE